VALIGLICGVGLAVCSSLMKVKEDERLPLIRQCLPGANCGACGYSGCDGYARALLEPGVKTNLCIPGADAVAMQLSQLLGVAAEDVIEQVAVVHCGGDCKSAPASHDYRGIQSCAAARLLFGGDKHCVYGCLGLGDCAKVCPKGCIDIRDGIARVDAGQCMGCGLCAKACPQQIISLVPDVGKVVVLCANRDKGAQTRKDCAAGCIGCKKCEKVCENGAIAVKDNHAAIDYALCTGCGSCVQACPTGALQLRDLAGAHQN